MQKQNIVMIGLRWWMICKNGLININIPSLFIGRHVIYHFGLYNLLLHCEVITLEKLFSNKCKYFIHNKITIIILGCAWKKLTIDFIK
jgi:hypothetical protein